MKLNLYLLIISIVINFSNTISQESEAKKNALAGIKPQYIRMIVRTAPKFTLQFSIGYNHGIYELSGNDNGDFNSLEFYNGKNFGVRHGLGAILTAKIPLHKKGNIRLNISAMYNKFNSKIIDLNGGYADFDVYSGALGLENNFTPSYKFKTLVGAGFVASVITGKTHFVNESINEYININPAFRLGVIVYTGFEYMMNDNMGLNMGYQFVHANLWLKKSKPADNEHNIYLNDERVSPRIPYSGWKQFAWGSFFGGVNIYFGIARKDYVVRTIYK